MPVRANRREKDSRPKTGPRLHRSDAELVQAARSGDERAIDRLLSRYEKRIWRFGLRMCGAEEDAKEVLQKTLLSAFRHVRQFRGDAELSTWLYQLARSQCLKVRRKRVGEPSAHEPLESALAVPAPSLDPEANAHAKEMGELLAAAILALSDAHREVLVLRDVEGLSAEEAARILELEVGALKSRLHRARLELRRHLSALMGEAEGDSKALCLELQRELKNQPLEDIDQAACERIEAHLRRCPRCRAAQASLGRTVALCRRIRGDGVPAPVRAAVKRALLSALSASD